MGNQHQRFHLRSLDQLRDGIRERGLRIPIDEDLSVLGQPLDLGGRPVPNRFAVQPMEGFDADANGSPGALSLRRYIRYARGGFGLIWFEATAVMREARSNPHQLYLHADNMGSYRELVTTVRTEAAKAFGREPVIVIQLTHSGRYSKPDGTPAPIIAHHSPVLDPRHGLGPDYPVVTDEYLDRLRETYVATAKLAARAGFDGVDIKACHRYLVSELLASFTREGRYGGSFENRTRLLRETLAQIKANVPGLFVTTRMNAYDAIPYPYGFGVNRIDYRTPDLDEPIRLAGTLHEIGAPILNLSIGNPYFNPHYGRPYDFPVYGAPVPDEHPVEGLSRFLNITRQVQQAHEGLPLVGSGYSWLRQFIPYVAAGVIRSGGAALVGMGRSAFAYPDAVRDILDKGRMEPSKCCITCSACTQIMRDGGQTGCVVRDSDVYGPEYRKARRFALDRLRDEARRCRNCETPTCARGCPANVDVPAFIQAFAEDDIETAYRILHDSNPLPELCGYVCPAEVQCEGACLENIFCEHPIPIQDIQLATCRLARTRGLTGVRLPDDDSGKRVAVVGGGPAGISCAIRLLERGHHVAIFEKAEHLGGVPDTTIPSERYEELGDEIAAILAPAIRAGRLTIELGKPLGPDLELGGLREDFDAVLLAAGLGQSASLGRADGVVDALQFLRDVKAGRTQAVPDRVAVLGGGNTAMDAATAALRLGARDVYLVYRRSFAEMPAWPAERDAFLAAGGHCLILTQPLGYVVEDGRLKGVKIVRTELGAPDTSRRRRPIPVEGSESVLRVEMAIEAIGQEVSNELRQALPDVPFTERGLVRTVDTASSATELGDVFAAGDLVNGGTTAVQGVAQGLRAADEIDSYLRHPPPATPSSG